MRILWDRLAQWRQAWSFGTREEQDTTGATRSAVRMDAFRSRSAASESAAAPLPPPAIATPVDALRQARAFVYYRQNPVHDAMVAELRQRLGHDRVVTFVVPAGTESLDKGTRAALDALRAEAASIPVGRLVTLRDETMVRLANLPARGSGLSLDFFLMEAQHEPARQLQAVLRSVARTTDSSGQRPAAIVLMLGTQNASAPVWCEWNGCRMAEHGVPILVDGETRWYRNLLSARDRSDVKAIFDAMKAPLEEEGLSVYPGFELDGQVVACASFDDVSFAGRKVEVAKPLELDRPRTAILYDRHFNTHRKDIPREAPVGTVHLFASDFGYRFVKHEGAAVNRVDTLSTTDPTAGREAHLTGRAVLSSDELVRVAADDALAWRLDVDALEEQLAKSPRFFLLHREDPVMDALVDELRRRLGTDAAVSVSVPRDVGPDWPAAPLYRLTLGAQVRRTAVLSQADTVRFLETKCGPLGAVSDLAPAITRLAGGSTDALSAVGPEAIAARIADELLADPSSAAAQSTRG